jgi:hypothetical protein
MGKIRYRRSVVPIAATVCSIVGALVVGVPQASGCVNEQSRRVEADAIKLPDCRAYEQVSPVAKNLTDAVGKGDFIQSSPKGNSVIFFALLPFPETSGSGDFVSYLSSRGGEEWSTQGLVPPTNSGSPGEVVGVTEDLSTSIVAVGEEGPLLAPGGAPGLLDYYFHNDIAGGYQSFAPAIEGGEVFFADASSDDSRILFEDTAKLAKGAVAKVMNLYEWSAGQITLVGVLPNGEAPVEGAVAGPGGGAIEELEPGQEFSFSLPGGSRRHFYTQNAMSEDGSRIFFTDVGSGHIYMREPASKTTTEVSAGQAYWRAATPSEGSGPSRNLYRFNVASEVREALTTGAAHVLGTLGISDGGSYVYFVADGALAGRNAEGNAPEAGEPNLYEWHEGAGMTFVDTLKSELDEPDWTDNAETVPGPAQGGKTSRVTPDGHTVLFTSANQLTSYANAGHVELYIFDALTEGVTCISCNPSGTAASSGAQLTDHAGFGPEIRNSISTRNFSEDGDQVFFQTAEALVPQDTNGQMDVYEWERESTGTCGEGGGDCVYLISTGEDPSESYFGDASTNGSDVFFFTRQSLVGQDQDENADLYDAREGGGIEAQNPILRPVCESESSCRPLPGPTSPSLGPATSATFVGPGDSVPRFETKKETARKVAKKRRGKRKHESRGRKKGERKGRDERQGIRKGPVGHKVAAGSTAAGRPIHASGGAKGIPS